jgi:hypothetical protein
MAFQNSAQFTSSNKEAPKLVEEIKSFNYISSCLMREVWACSDVNGV